ncbi:Hypothetical predicted protein [Lecanosticta acicola]|uniref:Uncharacterized protein n=1 Tax=Lecanosticta acicola TaxID=111012 RepID=A0AAI9ECD2_9PEZI|nr:Hypothetical predicted protein [Lecanosticta acicola]
MAEGESRRPNSNIGRRIIGSARGLACSTFSGVAGIEAEFDPLHVVSGGKRVTGPQTPEKHAVGEVSSSSKERRRSGAAPSRFRSRIGSERISQRDAEFQEFVERMDDIVDDDFVRPSFEARLQDHAYGADGDALRQTTFRKQQLIDDSLDGLSYDDNPTLLDSVNQLVQGQTTRLPCNLQQTSIPDRRRQAEVSMLQASWEKSASVAAQRLSQVEKHLSGSFHRVAARSYERSMTHHDRLMLHHDVRHDSLDVAMKDEPEDFLDDHSKRDITTQSQRGEEEEILSGDWFHCSYEECHRRLTTQNSSLGLSIHQRCCVHTGCGYVSPNIPEWIEHCSSEHHMVPEQGKTSLDPRHVRSCKYCKFDECDTH